MTSPAVFAFNPGGPVIVPVHADPGSAPLTTGTDRQFGSRLTDCVAGTNPVPITIRDKDDGRTWARTTVENPSALHVWHHFTQGHEHGPAFTQVAVEFGLLGCRVGLMARSGTYAVAQQTGGIGRLGSPAHFMQLRLPVPAVRDLLGEGKRVFASPVDELRSNIDLARDLAIAVYLDLVTGLPEYVRLNPVQGNSPMPPDAQIDVSKLEGAAIEITPGGPRRKIPDNDLVFWDATKLIGADRLLQPGVTEPQRGWRRTWPDITVEYVPSENTISVRQAYSETTYPLSPTVLRLFRVAEAGLELRAARRRPLVEAERAAQNSRGGPPV